MIIDDHRHIGNCEGRGIITYEMILDDMKKKRIDVSVVCPGGAADEDREMARDEAVEKEMALLAEAGSYFADRKITPLIERMRKRRIGHSKVKEAIIRSQGRIKGGWFLSPWAGQEEFAEAEDALKNSGFVYLKLHPQHHCFCPDDRDISHVYEFAASIDVPVWFHSSYGPGSEIRRIAEAAKMNPHVILVMGHACVEPGPSLMDDLEEAFRHDNIYLELAHVKIDDFVEVLRRFPHGRLIAGTDNPCDAYDTVFDHFIKRKEKMPCTEGSWEKILGGNAAEIYRI